MEQGILDGNLKNNFMEEFKNKLINFLREKKFHNSITKKGYLIKKFPEIINYAKDEYNYSGQIYCFINEINYPICRFCGEPYKFISFRKGFLKNCSKKCGLNTIIENDTEMIRDNGYVQICELHKTIKSQKVFDTLKKYNPEVFCEKCAQEILAKGIIDEEVLEKSKESILRICNNRDHSLYTEKIKYYYPNLFLHVEKIQGIKPDNFRNRLNYFLFDYNIKCPKCGKNVSFGKDFKPKEFCEECNRKIATKESSMISKKEYWKQYLLNNFNINTEILDMNEKTITLSKFCLHNDNITIDKNKIKLLKKRGIFSVCNECNREFYKSKIYDNKIDDLKRRWNFIKTLSEEKLLNYDPYLWSFVYDHMNKMKASFSEAKFMLKYGILARPKCLVCDDKTSFSDDAYGYNLHCDNHLNSFYSSSGEIEIKKYLDELNISYIENTREVLDKKELDIWIPKYSLAIEFNGLYWHGENSKTNKNYHYEKWKECHDKGIFLLTIWEDDWNFKRDIIKSIIKNKLGLNAEKIYGRNTLIKILDNDEKKKFLEENHLQGNINGFLNLGLFYQEKLVSVMCFGKKRMITNSLTENNHEYELLRYCNKINCSIIGGASKLFKYFINNYEVNKIISYASLDISNGGIYEKMGFKDNGFIGLNYWWVKDGKKYHRSNFMKYKLIKEGFDEKMTEDEIMYTKKYYKLWGCGNSKWIYICNNK
jgi:hypothetical protein